MVLGQNVLKAVLGLKFFEVRFGAETLLEITAPKPKDHLQFLKLVLGLKSLLEISAPKPKDRRQFLRWFWGRMF